jgi:hypothetical protein
MIYKEDGKIQVYPDNISILIEVHWKNKKPLTLLRKKNLVIRPFLLYFLV